MRFVLLAGIIFSIFNVALADEFSSDSFRVLDPVLAPAGFSTSDNFQLWSTVSEIAPGTSTASSFEVGGGFLRYPLVLTPTVSATAGDAQVALSWTAAQGFLGWTPTTYSVGQAGVSGGPYTYTSVGANRTSTQTGLTNGNTYYFVVIVEDVFTNAIATSTEVSSVPATSGAVVSTSGGSVLRLGGLTVVPEPPPRDCVPEIKADLNCDGSVGLADLSVFLYLSPQTGSNPADFNLDGVVDSKDLSLMFYGWTDELLAFTPDGGAETASVESSPVQGTGFLSSIAKITKGNLLAGVGASLGKLGSPSSIGGFFERVWSMVWSGLKFIFIILPKTLWEFIKYIFEMVL